MIRCVIIDDEKPARDTLNLMLKRYFSDKVEVVGLAASLKEGVLTIYDNKPDLVFLDIEMPGEDGFSLFRYFQHIDFSVIFTTAYTEYAIKAIKVSALDYILKPIGVENLKESISRFEKMQLNSIQPENFEKLVHALSAVNNFPDKVALPTFSGFQIEKIHDMMYCEADRNYTNVFLKGGRKLLISKSLNSIEDMLPVGTFFRIHKSYLVNLEYVKTFSRTDGFHVVLDNGNRLTVAIRRKDELVKLLTGGTDKIKPAK